jgi:subtilisin family serine protease
MERGRKKRYLVMPGQGISGATMESAVFHDGAGHELMAALKAGLDHFRGPSLNTSLAATAPAPQELNDTLDEPDFQVLQQRFPDGPAVVTMTETARLALEASLPNVRVLPITQYYLPGQNPRSRTKAAAIPSGESAAMPGGGVFLQDVKQDVLAGLSLPADQKGKGVRVAVLDTGVDATHPALAQAVMLHRCYVAGENPGAAGPVDWGTHPTAVMRAGHGTHVAGIIAARPGHGGPEGVAPEAQVLSYRVFPNNSTGQKGAENGVIIDSIRAAIDDGCHIVNLSLEGARLKEDGVRSAISEAWNQGVICVAAAGNGYGNPVSYPAALPHCVAVTAIGRDGTFPPSPNFMQHVSNTRSASNPTIFLAAFSNYGPPVQFTAPGHAIVSTFPGGGWWFESGTSMAAPFISGILARLLSGNLNILEGFGNAERSAAMMQMLIARANVLGMPQAVHEGYGLPA